MGVHMPPSPMPYQASRRGGRSRPRPQAPDRHRRSGGRGATATPPATCGTAGAHMEAAFSCTSTPMSMCTRGSAPDFPDSRSRSTLGEPTQGRFSGMGVGDGRPGRLRRVPGAAGLQTGPSRGAGTQGRGADRGAGLPGGGRLPVRPQGDLDAGGDGAGDEDRGLPALRASVQADGLCGAGAERAFEGRHTASELGHEAGWFGI